MSTTSSSPSASVVIATKVGAPFLDDCLESIHAQVEALGAEVIVVAHGPADCAERVEHAFPWVRVVHTPDVSTVPALRAAGVEHARGTSVAIIEEHCRAADGWLRRAVDALEGDRLGAVGGPVADSSYRRIRDWVVYFCEYNGWMPPVTEGEVTELNGANIAYRRTVLTEHSDLLGVGYWEATLHPVLLAERVRFRMIPDMVVHHCGPFDLFYYLQQRFWFSRAYAGARARTQPLTRRVAYLLGAPLVPFLLLARMASRVWAKRQRVRQFVVSLPVIMAALTVFVAGEWVGYLLGPGNALSKVE